MGEAATKLDDGARGRFRNAQRELRVRLAEELGGRGMLLGRSQLNDLWGETFGGRRNTFKVLGYKKVLRWRDYKARYDRDSIAGRIVDVPANYTWRNPPRILDGTAADTPFCKDLASIDERLKLYNRLEKVDRLSGVGRYGLLFLGSKTGGKDLQQPLAQANGPDDLAYLSVFSEGHSFIQGLEDKTNSERFGQPLLYQLDLTRGLASGSRGLAMVGGLAQLSHQRVHWSRLIHVAECVDEDEVFGVPRLQRVWNLMDDLIKCVGGSGEAFWRSADRGLQIDVDKDMQWDPEDKKDLENQIEEYVQDFRRIMRTRGVTMKDLGSNGVNPRGVFAVVSSLLVGATGIPLRILFGPERGQFSLGEERVGFLQTIQDRQRGYAEPDILRRTIDRLIEKGFVRKPTSARYTAEWPNLLKPTEAESAQIANQYGQAAAQFSAQAGKQTILSVEECRAFFPGVDPKKVPKTIAPPAPTVPAAPDSKTKVATGESTPATVKEPT